MSVSLYLAPNIANGEVVLIQYDIEDVVWHDPTIVPYWERLATAFPNPTNKNKWIANIMIKNIEMSGETVATLVASLLCRQVIFENTNLCGEGIVLLSTLVEQSPGLETLAISHNRIDDMNSALCLSRVLRPHLGMNTLCMSYCDLGSDPEILSVILQSDVSRIDLSRNDIDFLGAVKISEYLEGNPPVSSLLLDNNRFNDDDAILISRALKTNTNLIELGLRSNNFRLVGVKALLASVFDGSSLNAISESNHTCKLFLFSEFGPIQRDISSLNDNLNRNSKILSALHDKESLIEYLADVPVELMPYVLEFTQREGNQLQSTCMMYVAMRWWNMPSLYSFLRCVASKSKRKRDDEAE
jgi:hypothetical protein